MKLNINLGKSSYDILIEKNLIDNCAKYILDVYQNKNVYILTDSNVEKLYLESLIKALSKDFDVDYVVIPAGEENKNISTYAYVCEELIKKDIRRSHLLIGLGGGVVGDICGFVAATIYRGINYINIPTTLLSQMDSSIGGKTGIDFYDRKNILGAFKQPLLVLIDPSTLATLDKRELASGMGELIKHAAIGNKELWDILKTKPEITEDIIAMSLLVKKRVVEEDELDMGQRMILNFGHTFGHIIELKYGYKHGEAVAVGMLMAARYGIDMGITNPSVYTELYNILMLYNLPCDEYDYNQYLKEIAYDKKNIAGTINIVLVDEIGSTKIVKVNENSI